MSLANRYLQFSLQEEKMTLNIFRFNHLRFVWIDLSEIKHNYFTVIQRALRDITSPQPETVIIWR